MSSQELILPTTGQSVDLTDARQCAEALSHIRQIEQRFRDLKADLTHAIADEMRRQGTKTLHVTDGLTVELKGGVETAWDIETLGQLRELGLPEERWNALVTETVEYKVSTREAKRIAAANDEYARVIAAAATPFQKPAYVSFRRNR